MARKKTSLELQVMDAIKDGLDEIAREVAEQMSHRSIELMRARVSRGYGLHGRMPSYAASTKRRKARQGKPFDRRTLSDTGRMLAALRVAKARKQAGRWQAKVHISNRMPKEAEKARWTHQKTPWFGTAPAEQEQLRREAEALFAQLMAAKGWGKQ